MAFCRHRERSMKERAPVVRFAATGATTLVILFVLCWIGAVAWPAAFTHAFVTLFTAAPTTSRLALGQGICNALLFGFMAGAILALSYNLSRRLERAPQ